MSQYAPIVMFVYSRPDLTADTLRSLAQNKEALLSDLFIFADGPKVGASEQQLEKIQAVRAIINQQTGFKSVTVRASETNKGLANSVIAGVTEVVNRFGKVIVVEDDVSLSPYFLKFMNEALDLYENDEQVSGIGSWNYYHLIGYNQSPFFLRHPDTISWATYKRAWAFFNPDTDYLIREISQKGLTKYLNMENSIDLMKMLHRQKEGKVDSWAVRWTASMVLKNMLTLYPQVSLSRHEGYIEGTHFSEATDEPLLPLARQPLPMPRIPIKENTEAVKDFVRWHNNQFSLRRKIVVKLKNVFKNIFAR